MLFRMVLFLFGYGILLFVPGSAVAYIGYLALKPRYEAWQRRRLGARHAKQLAAHEAERCCFCLEPCTTEDCYDQDRGWYHAKCLKALLG